MNQADHQAFTALFREAYQKCFGHPLTHPLSETEGKLFYNQLLEQTGLVIGFKTIKNYAAFVLQENPGKEENPSVATLDTLARYVLGAPYTSEPQRKAREGHYPYWFRYKEQLFTRPQANATELSPVTTMVIQRRRSKKGLIAGAAAGLVLVAVALYVFNLQRTEHFTETFHSVAADSLQQHGWLLQHKNEAWWNKRNQRPGMLTLFTLQGDTWPDSSHQPDVQNLLLHQVSADCFTAELHLEDFFPQQRWQQAGILLCEDTGFAGKSLRLSLAYNDFFGGYNKPREVIIQAVTSLGNGLSHPEEIAHTAVFSIDPGQENLVQRNLQHSGLRVEKQGNTFRLLYSNGAMDNYAFKEAVSREFVMKVNYIGIFAMQGFVSDTSYRAVPVSFFTFTANRCAP